VVHNWVRAHRVASEQQAHSASHQGRCDDDVAELRKVPAIRRQLDRLDQETLKSELREFGAWSDDELSDHDANLDRILWIAAGDIVEG
jgi:hypothetical protein